MYHARAALAAARPARIVLGRVAYTCRPVSVPLMLSALERSQQGDPIGAEQMLIDAAFPRVPWWVWWRDPRRILPALDVPTRLAIMNRLTAIPHDVSDDTMGTRLSAIESAQRQAVRWPTTPHGPRPSLVIAALTCRARLGDAWYFSPRRWGTADGYVPHAVCWVEYLGLAAIEAREELSQIRAYAVSQSGKRARAALEQIQKAAYPADPLVESMRDPSVLH